MSENQWDALTNQVNAAREAEDTSERVALLRSARDIVDGLMNDTMAEAVVYQGSSLRSVASAAGFADNAIRPRLAQTALLSNYADGGEVSIAGVHRARHDYSLNANTEVGTKKSPMKFVARRSSTTNKEK